MAYGTEERMWTLEEYIEKYEQLQAENKRLRDTIEHFMQCDCICGHCTSALRTYQTIPERPRIDMDEESSLKE